MLETTGQKLAWTSVGLGYGITLPIFGIQLLLWEMFIYFLFISIDYVSGYSAARKRKKVYSKVEREGLKEKIHTFILVGTLVIIAGGLNSTLGIVSIFVGLVPHFFVGYLVIAEFKSIIENYSVLFDNTKHERFFNIINYLVTKLFNLSLDKLKQISEQKIDNKFNK